MGVCTLIMSLLKLRGKFTFSDRKYKTIPCGGQIPPENMLGVSVKCKSAQKKPKKNITSETKKRTKPRRKHD